MDCKHVWGMNHEHDLGGWERSCRCEIEWVTDQPEHAVYDRKFKFCPDCGAALDHETYTARAENAELREALTMACAEWLKFPQKTSIAKMQDVYLLMKAALNRKGE